MTELQLKIKEALEKNSTARSADIAALVGTSASSVRAVKRLIVSGKCKTQYYSRSPFPKILIPAECPTCHDYHVISWRGELPAKTPKVYCKKHKKNRNISESHISAGYPAVPAKPKSHRIL
mgnify:CR=1 FL=1